MRKHPKGFHGEDAGELAPRVKLDNVQQIAQQRFLRCSLPTQLLSKGFLAWLNDCANGCMWK
jgi:hypothetical protein